MKAVDVAVVGAGPFGFSAAASLPQHDVLVFGQPMQTWSTTMPSDMLLRSAWSETSLAAPADAGSIVEWAKREGIDRQGPIPLSVFLAYSEWFRQTFVKELDVSNVARLERENDVFAIRTTVGDLVHARTVVVAVGVIPFSYAPPPLADPGGPGTVDGGVGRGLAIYQDLALVGRVHPLKDLHQGRFAGAVAAGKGMYFTLGDFEADVA